MDELSIHIHELVLDDSVPLDEAAIVDSIRQQVSESAAVGLLPELAGATAASLRTVLPHRNDHDPTSNRPFAGARSEVGSSETGVNRHES